MATSPVKIAYYSLLDHSAFILFGDGRAVWTMDSVNWRFDEDAAIAIKGDLI
jgi:hypothetical protein